MPNLQYSSSEATNKNISITLPFFKNLALSMAAVLNRILVFLQLREKRRFWGIVYDSVSKQPLDPVRVSLVYADSGKLEGSCITDMEGRYGFLARPGRFKILVQRTNYAFPSKFVSTAQDGIYSHLYHGEFFDLAEDSDVVAPNIPMDPISNDWNQQAKKRFVHKAFYSQWFLEKLVAVFLWFGFVYASVLLVLSKFSSAPLLMAVSVYLVFFVLELVTPRLRMWGKVIDFKTGQPIMGLTLQLLNPKAPGVVFGFTTTRKDGKFFLRANRGSYILAIADADTGKQLGRLPVKIGRELVLNSTIEIQGLF